jgi:hypothetical protein
MHTILKGPLLVVQRSESTFTLLDLITHKEKDYNVTDITPFVFNLLLVDPTDVARKDYLEFFIGTALGHLRQKLGCRQCLQNLLSG